MVQEDQVLLVELHERRPAVVTKYSEFHLWQVVFPRQCLFGVDGDDQVDKVLYDRHDPFQVPTSFGFPQPQSCLFPAVCASCQ